MLITIRKASLASLVALLLASGCGRVLGNHILQSQDRTPSVAFHQVQVSNALAAQVTEGDTASVSLRTDSNLLSEFTIRVADDTLIIENTNDLADLVVSGGSMVTIVMPHLTGASVSGASSISVTQSTTPTDLSMNVSGAGQITYTGQALRVTANVSGSGGVALSGSGQSLSAHDSGSGTVDARAFAVVSGDFSISGSGNVTATVTGQVSSADLSGSGSLDLYGGASISPNVSGSGRVVIH